ncbi:MAG: acyl-CoA dehydrogenase [Proteobacteria bacterium]|nr:acyl-CoA dehydrogenase [Desulfobacula sp.]MBU3952569.1 acyl-CoA dehydrogenase [Pseudomonadota bacterium]MBU4133424.1 acyl-CoA dehydrogenase [Pseudomonadota bacterium]
MAHQLADRRDVDFVVFEQLESENILTKEKFKDLNRKALELAITEARNLSIKEILPTNVPGDREGVLFEKGEVRVPEAFHRAYKLYCQGEWIAFMDDVEVGGQGMPATIWAAVTEYFVSANLAFIMYPGLCHGIGKVIETYGTFDQKAMYLEKLYAGQWGGAMLLTEPQAGSDVGELSCEAVKNEDNTYSIIGSKIFITGGEHNLTSNIIHLVLARIKGAPKGSRGISLFIVPKRRVNPDGSLGEANDVICTGIEEKMGIHGSATCCLSLGDKGNCRGELIGEENKGLKAMFCLMNEARIGVALQGQALAGAAYAQALTHAKQRCQGKNLLQIFDPDAVQVPIIQHPDVRRMLIWMKAHVEGMRSLIYYTAHCLDLEAFEEKQEDREKYKGLIEFLTPILKCYCSEKSFDVCTQALQVFGGYGYTTEYPMEQYLRDCKITSIYEGTSGVQSMDLLGRKLGMKNGKIFADLLGEMEKTIAAAKQIRGIKDLADKVERAVIRSREVALALGTLAMGPDLMTAFTFSHPFLMALGDVTMAWMHLQRAVKAVPELEKQVENLDAKDLAKKAATNKQTAFYQGVFCTARFFINSELPVTMGKFDAIAASDPSAMEMPEVSFGS